MKDGLLKLQQFSDYLLVMIKISNV